MIEYLIAPGCAFHCQTRKEYYQLRQLLAARLNTAGVTVESYGLTREVREYDIFSVTTHKTYENSMEFCNDLRCNSVKVKFVIKNTKTDVVYSSVCLIGGECRNG